jgi:hypothetical protein
MRVSSIGLTSLNLAALPAILEVVKNAAFSATFPDRGGDFISFQMERVTALAFLKGRNSQPDVGGLDQEVG